MRHPEGRNPNARLGCAQAVLPFTAGPLLWWLAFPVMRLPVPIGVLFMAAFLTTGSYALTQLWVRAARRRSPLTAPQPAGNQQAGRPSFRTAFGELFFKSRQTAMQRFVDEVTERQKPYHVAWEGARLTITPPPPPGVFGVSEASGLRKRRSWSFSPGGAELATSWGAKRPKVTRYVVESVEIAHDTWTNGHGVTDRLKITGPAYASTTVAAIDDNHRFNALGPPGKDWSWCLSPTLTGAAIDRGLPAGVGEGYDSDVITTVAPTILALSRLITDATRRPLTILVGSCKAPDNGD